MDQNQQVLHLHGTDTFITEEERSAYRVQSGRIYVFVAPLKNGKPNLRRLLCEVEAGHLIPSFRYQDDDYTQWRFVLVPQNEAELICLPGQATSVLYRRFAKSAGLENFQQEGFAQSLVDYYKRESLKDHVFVDLGSRQRPDVNIANYGMIRQSFSSEEGGIESNNPLYRAVAYACRKSGIPILEEERISAAQKKKLSVTDIARASRFLCRRIVLEEGWYEKDCGTIFGFIEERPVSCVPRGQRRYTIYYGDSDTHEPLTKEVAETVNPRAFLLGRKLPPRALKKGDLIRFGAKSLRRADVVLAGLLGLASALIGILLPALNQKIYDDYIPLGHVGQMIQLCMVIATFMLGSLFFDMVKSLSEHRIGSHVCYDLQNAVYSRAFHLPESFFREHESAELAQRLSYMTAIAKTYVSSTLINGMGAIFSLLYFYRMFKYGKKLVWWALLMLAVYAGIQLLINRKTIQFDGKIEADKGKANGKLFQFLTGIEKIRMAGVEDRAAREYLRPFAERQSFAISKNHYSAWSQVLSGGVGTLFSLMFYLAIVKGKVEISSGQFMAFNAAFDLFSSAILGVIGSVLELYQLKPIYARIRPVLDCPEEDDTDKEVVPGLRGEVSLSNVAFAYDKSSANVLNGIDLDIAPGEYVGIVGASGSGKSTLLKLLLGFEEPDEGQICYDGKNLRQLDKRELRKNLGVVLQNGKLIAGSIFENITITAPHATLKEVKAVIEAVGLKEDIDRMPMGVHTMLSENSSTISGGQQQRILIARAIINHPAVLIFDEATSALDNVTQAAVCESLDRMNVTRIVVAHRLSTIKNCDRIVVLDGGKIVEEGNYESLMAKKGLFSRFASRQLV